MNRERRTKFGSIIVRLYYSFPHHHAVIENLRGIRFFYPGFYLFVLIPSILESIHEHLKKRGPWKSTEILKILGPLVELYSPSFLSCHEKNMYIFYTICKLIQTYSFNLLFQGPLNKTQTVRGPVHLHQPDANVKGALSGYCV